MSAHFALTRGTHYSANTSNLILRANCKPDTVNQNPYIITCGFIPSFMVIKPSFPSCNYRNEDNCTSFIMPVPFTGTAFY